MYKLLNFRKLAFLFCILAFFTLGSHAASAESFTNLQSFNGTNGQSPKGSLIKSGGKFYGLTEYGGTLGFGVIFEYNPTTSTYTNLYNFDSTDGERPQDSLIEYNGKFYGLTMRGGASSSGVIFEFNPTTNVYTKLHDFDGIDGSNPSGSLVVSNGNLYGLTYVGGNGIIFKYDITNSTFSNIYNFDGTNGRNPFGSLIVKDNKFYGMTSAGGTSNLGVIFEYNPATSTYTNLYSFDGTYGGQPQGSLMEKDGNFYGLTFTGGSSNAGVLFEYNPNTSTYTDLFDFNNTNGASPTGSLIVYNGKLYGQTSAGGTRSFGVLFEYDTLISTFTKKFEFDFVVGAAPRGSLLEDNGTFYGLTYAGGSNNNGTIFAWEFDNRPIATSVAIAGTVLLGNTLTGQYVYTDVESDPEGTSTYKWYRNNVAISGATSITYIVTSDDLNKTIKFEVTPVASTGSSPGTAVTSSVTPYILYESADTSVTPGSPGTLGTADNLASIYSTDSDYWTTALSVTDGGYDSQVFKIKLDSSGITNPKFSVVWTGHGDVPTDKMVTISFYNFITSAWEQVTTQHCSTDCTLTGNKTGTKYMDVDGNTWVWIKADNYVAPIEISNLVFSNVSHTVSWDTNVVANSEIMYSSNAYSNWDQYNEKAFGASPYGSLIEYNGSFYGMTTENESNTYDVGTIFEYNPDTSTYTNRFNFNSTNGANPKGSLLNVSGIFYGTTNNGGANSVGTLFAWDPVTNTITKQYDFSTTDGAHPYGSLINVSGILYGTTANGGANDAGTLFAWDPVTNTITKQYDFNTTDGSGPQGTLLNIDGILYGTAFYGGANSVGTLFAWDPVANTITKQYDFNTTDGVYPSGSLLNISGTLYGTTNNGGSYDAGILFAWDPVTNTMTKQYDFNGTVGQNPLGTLINVSGILYGTAFGGGANNYGTLFAWDPVANTITNQYDFDYNNGSYPRGSLIESDGKFYGLASNGGSTGAGAMFEYDFNTSTYTVLHEYINNLVYYVRDDALSTSHSISVTYGTPTLYYIVRSTDASANVATSEIGGPYASSCPYIFVWDGEKYVFVTDASSSATLSIGLDRATWAANPFYKDPNTNNNYPNPEGYAKIQSGNLVARTVGNETFYDIKNTTELNEINYFDSTSLKIIDHDASVNVFPDYRENGQIHTVAKNAPAPVSVIDQDGEDVTNLLSQNDGVYYHSKLNVTPAYIDIKLSNDITTPANLKMLIERGKEGPFSGGSGTDTLQYKNEAGEFVDVPSEYNVFVTQREGAPYPSRLRFNSYGVETKVIDLSGLTIKDNTIRLVMTNTKRMWDIDYLAVDTNPDSAITVTSENPYYADLHFRGISSKVRTNPNDPNMILTEPVYSEVTDAFISNKTTGNATKYGDVTELLQSNDDKFVIMTQGDELAFKYAVPAQAPGTERDFIYYTNDYHKAYIYALGDEIGPLPFSAMTQYPYHTDVENYPTDAEHNLYQSIYNTRAINFTGLRSDIVPGQLHHSLNTDYFVVTVEQYMSTPTYSHVKSGSYAPGYGPKIISQYTNSNTIPSSSLKQCNADQILTQNLKAGAKNGKYNSFTKNIVSEVKILQAHMNRLGFAAGKEDGILGPITDGAIKRMQKSLGTKQDGLVGPMTRALINNSCGAKA